MALAALSAKAAEKSLKMACDKGSVEVGKFVKDIVRARMDTACSPEFPTVLSTQLFASMKASTFFPRQIREYLEKNPAILRSFIDTIVKDPRFTAACQTKDAAAMDAMIDEKAAGLKSKLTFCANVGGRRRKVKKTKRRAGRRSTRRRV